MKTNWQFFLSTRNAVLVCDYVFYLCNISIIKEHLANKMCLTKRKSTMSWPSVTALSAGLFSVPPMLVGSLLP